MIDCELLRNCALVRIKIRAWSNTRGTYLPDDAIAKIVGLNPSDPEYGTKLKASRSRFKVGKRLIDCEEYDALRAYQTASKNYILANFANPSGIDDGLYAVLLSRCEQVNQEILSFRNNISANLIPAFKAKLVESIARSKEVLGDAFNPKDYPDPEQVGRYFSIEHRFIAFSVPDGLPKDLREQEEKKLREAFDSAKLTIMAALWEEFQALIGHISERLESGPEGRNKKFNETLFEGLNTFVQAFENKNAFNDERLSKVVGSARSLLEAAKVGGGDLNEAARNMRDFPKVREQMQAAFTVLKTEVDKGISELPVRSFDFGE